MIVRVFADTNVLIYARDIRESAKHRAARRWLEELASRRLLLTNMQVLNEFTRWLLLNERAAPIDALRDEVQLLGEYGGNDPLSPEDTDLAWNVRARLGYQWFDCLLIAAAVNAGCSHFLSEDMGHETRYGSLTIINPFRVDPDAFLKAN